MITFSVLIYAERILINDILLRMFFLIKDKDQLNQNEWLKDLIDVHVAIYNVTDFLGGSIQLYLTTWFTQSTYG